MALLIDPLRALASETAVKADRAINRTVHSAVLRSIIEVALQQAQALQREADAQFRMDELEAVMLSVDKWLTDAPEFTKLANPATRAAAAREIALRAIEKARRNRQKADAQIVQAMAATAKQWIVDADTWRLGKGQRTREKSGYEVLASCAYALQDQLALLRRSPSPVTLKENTNEVS